MIAATSTAAVDRWKLPHCVPGASAFQCDALLLEELNALAGDAAIGQFMRCCASSRWAQRMAGSRPFRDLAAMSDVSDAIWSALQPDDWLEAFAGHPKIGAGARAEERPDNAAVWSAQEQARVAEAPDATLQLLADRNRAYEARFGYIFIVCASGKSAAEMLEILERRLRNDPAREIEIAADAQRQITRLRLAKLLEGQQETRP